LHSVRTHCLSHTLRISTSLPGANSVSQCLEMIDANTRQDMTNLADQGQASIQAFLT
jgi:hypothetical protein